MAQLLNATRFVSPSTAVTTIDVTIPATTAGSTLVCVAGGGATIQAKLGVGGTNFTKRTSSLNFREVVAQDIVDAGGGTTTIELVLNGPENIDGVIFEFASGTLGNFIDGATELTGSASIDGRVATATFTTTGPAVIFAMFTLNDGSGTPNPQNQLWGFEPFGKQYANEFIFPDTSKGAKYWSLIGVSDQANAGTYDAQTSTINPSTSHQSAAWAYENLDTGTPTYANPYSTPIAEENSLPGDLQSTWFGDGTSPNVAGYTDRMSYAPGDTVSFKVDSANNAFNVHVYRTGYYGYTLFGARLQASITGTPAVQPSPTVNSYGGTECAWSTTATWDIPADAVPGVYVFVMDRGGSRAQGVFVVHSTPPGSQTNGIMVATADFTWQAYNLWGASGDTGGNLSGYNGRSLYKAGPAGDTITARAFAVSYDRPMSTVSSNANTYFWDSEFALTNFLEGNGYELAYYAMTDIQGDTTIPSKYTVAVASGHSEYWTSELRDAFENARDAGTNLFLNTANTSLWHTRFDPGDTNFRNMICYKDSHDTVGYDGTTKYDPVSYTGTWRDSRTNPGGVNNPERRPEPGMTGQWFIGNGLYEDTLALPATYASLPIWRNTDLASSPAITVRGTGSTAITTPGTSLTIDQPAGTLRGDLLVVSVTYTGSAAVNPDAPFRIVRTTTATTGGSQTTVILMGYALGPGTVTHTIFWGGGALNVSASLVCYGNAVWEDPDTSLRNDTGGTAAHTTHSISNDGATRWAVCVFADNDTTGSQKTTTWTPGTGLTSRVQTTNAASGSGPWCSNAIMDTNGAVTQGVHQYTATAEFANPQAFAGIFYISPGIAGPYRSVGGEWDYLKADEPSTPTNIVRLSRQVLTLRGAAANYNGDSYGEYGLFYYGLTLYQADSGALVFNSGAWRFSFGLSRFYRGFFDNVGTVDTNIQQAVLNMLADMGSSPTTLLGTTANLSTTALVDPGAAQPASAYGFPVAAPTVYQNMFGSMPPTSYTGTDNTPYTLGTLFTSDVQGTVYGVRWHFPGIIPDTPVIAVLYSWTNDTTGVELERTTFANMQSGWNEVLFSSPVAISGDARYVVAVWTQDYYVTAAGQFASAGVTSGDLTASQDAVGAHNGKFINGVSDATYPNSSFSSNSYLVDILFMGEGFEGWGIPSD